MAIYLSEKLKQFRKSRDLTQEQIADIFHVSPQAVSRWETGVSFPDIEMLPSIAEFFKVTVDDLLGGGYSEERTTDYRNTQQTKQSNGEWQCRRTNRNIKKQIERIPEPLRAFISSCGCFMGQGGGFKKSRQ